MKLTVSVSISTNVSHHKCECERARERERERESQRAKNGMVWNVNPRIHTRIRTLIQMKTEINFENYAISIVHSDTNFLKSLQKDIKIYFQALKKSKKNYIILYPNNDPGSEIILNEIKKINKSNKNFRILPSMRFEYYLTLLKNSKFIIGNSSSGIMEAPICGIPTINIGNRQYRRAKIDSINNCNFDIDDILSKIKYCSKIGKKYKKSTFFGAGNSYNLFQKILNKDNFWKNNYNKQFKDLFFSS